MQKIFDYRYSVNSRYQFQLRCVPIKYFDSNNAIAQSPYYRTYYLVLHKQHIFYIDNRVYTNIDSSLFKLQILQFDKSQANNIVK